MNAVLRFVRRDEIQVGAICILFAVMWGTLFAGAYNDEKALKERADRCSEISAGAERGQE